MAAEKRLIDANALLDYFRNEHHESEVIEAVKDAPTVDAVEVVRCKDCKHWKYDARKLCGICDALMCFRPDYFWCMYGERGTDNG